MAEKQFGISGIDGNMIYAKQKNKKLGFVGEIEMIDVSIITDLLEKGYVPIISSIATDINGGTYNINSDILASGISGKLNAERLFILTNVKGIYRDFNDKNSLIEIIKTKEVKDLIDQKYIVGGMIPKAECAVDAIKSGTEKVTIIDGTEPHSIIKEMFTVKGYGTMFEK